MEMKQRMLNGDLYLANDPELVADRERARALVERFNGTTHEQQAERTDVLGNLLGAIGEEVVINPAFQCDYGFNISIGDGTFVNYDCIMLDEAKITLGACCQIATRVQFLTATHPIDPVTRRAGWEFAEPIALGDNVWLGGGTIVCPGVSIGEDTVVGAGSVVTRGLPGGVVAAGTPARVLRSITEQDDVAPSGS